jgi:hypothetical protein
MLMSSSTLPVGLDCTRLPLPAGTAEISRVPNTRESPLNRKSPESQIRGGRAEGRAFIGGEIKANKDMMDSQACECWHETGSAD